MCDASFSVFHSISRLLDAHEELWDDFARHLGFDEDFVAENYLYPHGGGSPSRHFMSRLRCRRPNMKLTTFQAILDMHKMDDISPMLDDDDGEAFIDCMNYKIENIICTRLNIPQEKPRWKLMADTCGFSQKEIDEMASGVIVHNLYSPTTRILTAYRQRFPHDNFHKICTFLTANFCL